MTSSAPLTDLALRMLRDAAPGDLLRLDSAALLDLEVARAMTPAERLALLDALMRRCEVLGASEPDREPIVYHDIRM